MGRAATHHTLSPYLDVLTDAIKRHGGEVVHFAGDAVLADFTSVVAALTCVMEVQRDLAARNAALPDENRLRFRIGRPGNSSPFPAPRAPSFS